MHVMLKEQQYLHTTDLFVQTYVYFKMPSNLFVQMITHLSAPPEANLLPKTQKTHSTASQLQFKIIKIKIECNRDDKRTENNSNKNNKQTNKLTNK